MLRMYRQQWCVGLSEKDAIYDSQAIRQFVGVDLSRVCTQTPPPVQFRRLLKQQTERISVSTPYWPLEAQTVVDATIVAARPTKNRGGRDPNASTKGHFGGFNQNHWCITGHHLSQSDVPAPCLAANAKFWRG